MGGWELHLFTVYKEMKASRNVTSQQLLYLVLSLQSFIGGAKIFSYLVTYTSVNNERIAYVYGGFGKVYKCSVFRMKLSRVSCAHYCGEASQEKCLLFI